MLNTSLACRVTCHLSPGRFRLTAKFKVAKPLKRPWGVTAAPRRKLFAWHFQASPNVQEAKKRLDQLKPALLKGESNPDPSLTTR